MTRIGVVTGMAAEVRCLGRTGVGEAIDARCSGADEVRAAEMARRLLAGGVAGFVSFGIAGGLDPALRPGAVVIAETVIDSEDKQWPTDPAWCQALRAALGALGLATGAVAASARPLASPADKGRRYRETGAAVVDTESAAVARLASEADVPFVVVRAVADPARRALPTVALRGLGADGRVRIGVVLGRLVLRPWELAAVSTLAGDTARALASLRRCAALAGPLFCRGPV